MSCSQPKMARYNVDRVVHLANILGGPASEKAVPYLRVQCMGTANVFEACRIHGVSRVVYVSSVAVYGGIPNRDQEVTEEVVPRPNSFYGAASFGRSISPRYTHGYGLYVIGLRPTLGIRPGQRATRILRQPVNTDSRDAPLHGATRASGAGGTGGDAAG